MVIVSLKGYRIRHLEFVNNIEQGEEISLENHFSYNVKYANDNTCLGELDIEMTDKQSSKMSIKLKLDGIFDFAPNVKQEDIHRATFKDLYSYARAVVSTTTATSGMPPLFLPSVDIDNESIYKVSNQPE